jgi:hypothetical protein
MSHRGTLSGGCLGWLAAAALASAQIYNLSTFAGGAPIATPSPALQQAIRLQLTLRQGRLTGSSEGKLNAIYSPE